MPRRTKNETTELQKKVIAILKDTSGLSRAQIAAQLDIAEADKKALAALTALLVSMTKANTLVMTGIKRGARYSVSGPTIAVGEPDPTTKPAS